MRKVLLIIISLVVATVWISFLIEKIPPNNDEFGFYSTLGCLNAKVLSYTYPCNGEEDLFIFGKPLPLRPYTYLGSTVIVLYYPLYLIWRSYHSARFLNAVYFFLLAFFVHKATKLNKVLSILLVIFTMPLAIGSLIDPSVAYQCMAIAALAYFISTALDRKLWTVIPVGLFLFSAIEEKPIFLWVVPSTLLLGVTLALEKIKGKKDLSRFIRYIALMLVVSFIPLSILFQAKTRLSAKGGGALTYFESLRQGNALISVFDFSSQWAHFRKKFLIFLYAFHNFGHRIYLNAPYPNRATLFYWGLVFFVMGIFVYLALKKNIRSRLYFILPPVVCVLSFLVSYGE